MKVCEYLRSRYFSLQYIFQVFYVLCFTRPRYQVSVYRTIGPLVYVFYTLKQCLLCNINYSKEVFATCPSVSMAFCQKFMSVKTVARPFL